MASSELSDMRGAAPDQAETEATGEAEGKWRTALGGLAWGLYQTIRFAPEDAQAGIEEWAREFRTSKTAIRRALGELEGHGFITAYVEEE